MSFFRKFKKNHGKEKFSESAGKPPLSCEQVGKDLQSFLDGECTDVSADDLAAHLEACKDCGLEADVYRKIKAALGRRAGSVDPDSLDRLHEFGRVLAETGDPE